MPNNANVERFSGFAERYDTCRPQPPSVISDILIQLAQVEHPRLVVDLGSGTGLSTRIWSELADQVIGIEPNADMRRQAESSIAAKTGARKLRWVDAISSKTGLSDDCADIVTCSQSLHWMEPQPTLEEATRILRPGGVFAAYDCDWPPTVNWEAEAAYSSFIANAEAIGEGRGYYRGVEKWAKEQHLARMEASGCFRYLKEIVVHHQESGNDERFVGMALSQAGVAALFKHGLGEAEIGLDHFRAVCQRTIGHDPIPWYFSYRVRLGIR
jgi:ubiquinone/menaquinone biosynthesis C-methylase UbiE